MNRFGDIEQRGEFTIRRDEIRFGGLRVVWVVNGPHTHEHAFTTRRAARAYIDSPLRELDKKNVRD